MTLKRTKKRKKQRKLSPEERVRRDTERRFKVRINTIFKNAGFEQVPTRNHQFTFEGRPGEIDNLFLFENILVVVEDTCASSANLKDHINAKAVFFSHLRSHQNEFIRFLEQEFTGFKEKAFSQYDPGDYKVIYAYCSLNHIDDLHMAPHSDVVFFGNTTLRYFEALTKVVRRSARFELFKFFGLKPDDIGHNVGKPRRDYQGFVLPETPSGFPKDYKIATFYIDPQTLIELAYVLRKDSWLDKNGLYQRMLIKDKIKGMRKYLASESRAFVNNIIVSLPSDASLLDDKGSTVMPSKIQRTTAVTISLPQRFDSIGLIDGQHRVFAYHEGNDDAEPIIKVKRGKQQLLVTGIVFPDHIDDVAKMKFEAKLFLEINDKQSRAKGYLKQAIQAVVDPYHPIAIAQSVVMKLARSGPLAGLLQDHYFGEGRIKTTSIVSYAMKHIVGFMEDPVEHSLYAIWKHEKKADLRKQNSGILREEYISFCADQINNLLSAFKEVISPQRLWTADIQVSRALTITTINGLIYCLRMLLETGKTGDQAYYARRLKHLKTSFSPSRFRFKSSHWKSLGQEMYKECFES